MDTQAGEFSKASDDTIKHRQIIKAKRRNDTSQTPEHLQTLREVQTTNKFILRRLTQIKDQDRDVCTCDCHSKEDSKDIKALKTKVESIEEENKQRDDIVDQIRRELNELQEAFFHMRDTDPKLSDIYIPDRTLESASSKGIQHLQLGTEGKYGVDRHYSKSDDETTTSKESTDKLEPGQDRKTIKNNADTLISSTISEQNKEKQEKTDPKLRPQETVQVDDRCKAETKDDVETNRGSVDKETPVESVEIADKVVDSQAVFVYNVQEELKDEVSGPRPSHQLSGPAVAEGTHTRNKNSDATSGDARSNIETMKDDQEHLPHVIRQKQKAYKHELMWELLYSKEMGEAKVLCGSLGGIHMVVCLDISESMAQDGAWGQARRFFLDLINGLIKMKDEEGITDEHVALVTFGHDTRVVKRLTNHFEEVRASLDRIELGGPSPFFGGLKMAIAAAGSSDKQACVVNGLKVATKIVLITDGRPTQKDMVEGPDDTDYLKQDEVMAGSLQIMEDIARYDLDFFCVPVGKPDKDFLDLAVAIPKGKYLKYTDGERFSRRTFLTLKAGSGEKGLMGMLEAGMGSDIREYMSKNMPELKMDLDSAGQAALAMALGQQHGPDLAHLSQDDQEQIREIRERGHITMDDMLRRATSGDGGGGKYKESDSDVLPPLGTRVRRGPDWSWHTQDHEGPGTVIGHVPERKHLWVEWDADDHAYYYHYGGAGRYDILPVEEPRLPGGDGKLKVGCVVKPGKDWKDTRVQQCDRGVVIRLLTKADVNVKVRWTNGTRGNYAHNYKGKTEVEFSAPHGDTTTTQQSSATFGTSRRKNKNKNKNAK